MAISLTKGGNVNLSKEAPGLSQILVGLGWDARSTDGSAFDLDVVAFVVNEQGKVLSDQHFIFFNNTATPDKSVEHTGDNRSGEGDGDDEAIKVNLAALPAEVSRVVVATIVYEAEARKQNFGMVRNAYVRVVNQAGGSEIARYDLSEDSSTQTSMIFGEVYRHGSDWKFKAIGQGYNDGLRGLALDHGVNV